MNKKIIPLILVCAVFLNCSSNDKNPKKQIEENNYTASDTQNKPEDTTFKYPLIDTTLVFNSVEELKKYKQEFDEKLKALSEAANTNKSFALDSIKNLNEDLYTLLAYKLTNNTKQNIYLLLYNIDFSNFVSLRDRIQAFNSLPEQIKKGKEGKFVLERLNQKIKQSHKNIGLKLSRLPAFQLIDSSKKNYLLSNLLSANYQYTLLIFSASWCTPCRHEALLLKRQLSNIDLSQLQIITISVDKNIQKWKNAIIADACPWMQLWTAGEFNSDLVKELNIKMIPANFLLNKRQEVIAQKTNVNEIFSEFPNLYTK